MDLRRPSAGATLGLVWRSMAEWKPPESLSLEASVLPRGYRSRLVRPLRLRVARASVGPHVRLDLRWSQSLPSYGNRSALLARASLPWSCSPVADSSVGHREGTEIQRAQTHRLHYPRTTAPRPFTIKTTPHLNLDNADLLRCETRKLVLILLDCG